MNAPLWTRTRSRPRPAPAIGERLRAGVRRLHRHAHPGAGRSLLRHHGRRAGRPRFRARGPGQGRGGGRRRRRSGRRASRIRSRLVVVPDVLEAMRQLGRAARQRTAARDRRDHRLGRQDRHQGGHAPRPLAPGRDPCVGRLLQQPLGRAADARAHAARQRLRGVRDRHEPCRRDPAADRHGPAACGGRHHDRAGPYRVLPLDLGHRRRQGRDLLRAGARRRRR